MEIRADRLEGVGDFYFLQVDNDSLENTLEKRLDVYAIIKRSTETTSTKNLIVDHEITQNPQLLQEFIRSLNEPGKIESNIEVLKRITEKNKLSFSANGIELAEASRYHFTFYSANRSYNNLLTFCKVMHNYYMFEPLNYDGYKNEITKLKDVISKLEILVKTYESEKKVKQIEILHKCVGQIVRTIEFLNGKSNATLDDFKGLIKSYMEKHLDEKPLVIISGLADEITCWNLDEKGGEFQDIIGYFYDAKSKGHLKGNENFLLSEFLYKIVKSEIEIDKLKQESGIIETSLKALDGSGKGNVNIERIIAQKFKKFEEKQDQILDETSNLAKFKKDAEIVFNTIRLDGVDVRLLDTESMNELLNEALKDKTFQSCFNYSISLFSPIGSTSNALALSSENSSDKSNTEKNVHMERLKVAGLYITGISATGLGVLMVNPVIAACGVGIIGGAGVQTAKVYNSENPDNQVNIGYLEELTKSVDAKTLGESIVNYFNPQPESPKIEDGQSIMLIEPGPEKK